MPEPPAEWTVMARPRGEWTPVCRAGSREVADLLAGRLRAREGVEVVVTPSLPTLVVEPIA